MPVGGLAWSGGWDQPLALRLNPNPQPSQPYMGHVELLQLFAALGSPIGTDVAQHGIRETCNYNPVLEMGQASCLPLFR